eukprot:TRINITY_DN60772_c0_g1_i1.p1 TRINITY_DN60772_c0_g1~~TRINITY_DN60772_c0_g1_i1.p1  ORF type:complete len:547 (-),score=62.76 TRINITY_DN60772_c0_g1_i1:136-1776(-)
MQLILSCVLLVFAWFGQGLQVSTTCAGICDPLHGCHADTDACTTDSDCQRDRPGAFSDSHLAFFGYTCDPLTSFCTPDPAACSTKTEAQQCGGGGICRRIPGLPELECVTDTELGRITTCQGKELDSPCDFGAPEADVSRCVDLPVPSVQTNGRLDDEAPKGVVRICRPVLLPQCEESQLGQTCDDGLATTTNTTCQHLVPNDQLDGFSFPPLCLHDSWVADYTAFINAYTEYFRLWENKSCGDFTLLDIVHDPYTCSTTTEVPDGLSPACATAIEFFADFSAWQTQCQGLSAGTPCRPPFPGWQGIADSWVCTDTVYYSGWVPEERECIPILGGVPVNVLGRVALQPSTSPSPPVPGSTPGTAPTTITTVPTTGTAEPTTGGGSVAGNTSVVGVVSASPVNENNNVEAPVATETRNPTDDAGDRSNDDHFTTTQLAAITGAPATVAVVASAAAVGVVAFTYTQGMCCFSASALEQEVAQVAVENTGEHGVKRAWRHGFNALDPCPMPPPGTPAAGTGGVALYNQTFGKFSNAHDALDLMTAGFAL